MTPEKMTTGVEKFVASQYCRKLVRGTIPCSYSLNVDAG
jgi:hypothetical protein